MKQVKGDLITLTEKTDFDVIVHGCNCFNTMGAGIAKTIKERYPEAYREDCKTSRGDITKLGGYTWTVAKAPNTGWFFVIVNAYTQFNYGKGCQVDYRAIRTVFRTIAANFSYARIGYPRIGAGHGGGDWNIIEQIIDEELIGLNHTLVIL